MAADWLQECHFELLSFFKRAQQLCQWAAELPDPYDDQTLDEQEVYTLCEQWRVIEVDDALVWYGRAFALNYNSLVDGKYSSYHQVIFVVASDAASIVSAALNSNPIDWSTMVRNLKELAPVFNRFASVFDNTPGLLSNELSTAMNCFEGMAAQTPLVSPAGEIAKTGETPYWDSQLGKLTFRGKLIRTVVPGARNVRSVLDAFQELNWPPRIDDPLPGGRNQTRLNDTVKSLNENLESIRFHADGTGAGFLWEPAD